jgi:hypothetical protein
MITCILKLLLVDGRYHPDWLSFNRDAIFQAALRLKEGALKPKRTCRVHIDVLFECRYLPQLLR